MSACPRLANPSSLNHDRLHQITPLRMIHDAAHSVLYASEDRVPAIEVGLRRVRDEELGASSVGAGEGHAEGAACVLLEIDLVADGVARAAFLIVARVASLHDEVRHDAHEGAVVAAR